MLHKTISIRVAVILTLLAAVPATAWRCWSCPTIRGLGMSQAHIVGASAEAVKHAQMAAERAVEALLTRKLGQTAATPGEHESSLDKCADRNHKPELDLRDCLARAPGQIYAVSALASRELNPQGMALGDPVIQALETRLSEFRYSIGTIEHALKVAAREEMSYLIAHGLCGVMPLSEWADGLPAAYRPATWRVEGQLVYYASYDAMPNVRECIQLRSFVAVEAARELCLFAETHRLLEGERCAAFLDEVLLHITAMHDHLASH